eukprot:COSAG01_NODE_49610_length_370_cov_10.612546_1_plen_43_part_10
MAAAAGRCVRTAPVLQFGRVSDHEFTLDFRRPLNLVQAVHSFV